MRGREGVTRTVLLLDYLRRRGDAGEEVRPQEFFDWSGYKAGRIISNAYGFHFIKRRSLRGYKAVYISITDRGLKYLTWKKKQMSPDDVNWLKNLVIEGVK
jgi:hypothetical protein